MLAPIVLFTYNRLAHTRTTIEYLRANKEAVESELFIFSDYSKNEKDSVGVREVREYLHTIQGFKDIHIIERTENYGLAKSIVLGVSEIVNQYGKVIVVEDDIQTSPYFLRYMNDCLNRYASIDSVLHINAYLPPIQGAELPNTYAIPTMFCWGWGTWKRAWQYFNGNAQYLLDELVRTKRLKSFDLDGNFKFSSMLRANIRGDIHTWAVKWQASIFLQNGLCISPNTSLTHNIGNDSTGIHSGNVRGFDTTPSTHPIVVEDIDLSMSSKAYNKIKAFYKRIKPSFIEKLRTRLKFAKVMHRQE